eukprot:gene9252-10909_t
MAQRENRTHHDLESNDAGSDLAVAKENKRKRTAESQGGVSSEAVVEATPDKRQIQSTKPLFVLIHGNDLDDKFVSCVKRELDLLSEPSRPAKNIHVNDVAGLMRTVSTENGVMHNFCDHIVVLVSHSSLVIDDTTNEVSYISHDEMTRETIEYLRDYSSGFWFAGCDAANIDVTLCNATYNTSLTPTARIQPFGVVDFTSLSVPIVPASWLYAFLQVTREDNNQWWTCKKGFYYDISSEARAILLTSIWKRMSDLIRDLPFTDCLLYPGKISFPEVVHFAVFRAVYPHIDFQVLNNSSSVECNFGFDDARRHMLELTPTGKDGNENWLCRIDASALPVLTANVTDNLRSKFTSSFMRGHGPGLSGELRKLLRKHKYAEKCVSPSIAQEIRRRLLLAEEIGVPEDVKPHVAIVCRTVVHEQGGDMRMSISSEIFLSTVQLVCAKAKDMNWGVVLMDGDATLESLQTVLQIADKICGAHYVGHRHDESGQQLNILQQMQKIRRLVVTNNITAAVGIHGGFLDVLTLLGVPPKRTIHLCSDTADVFISEDLAGWKRRTGNFEDLFHGGEVAQWFETTGPSSEQVDQLFV